MKKFTLKVKFKNVTKEQAVALVNMFDEMERFGYRGHSAYIGFYADGDGNFHPVISHNLKMKKQDLEDYKKDSKVYENGRRTHDDANANSKKFPWTDSITLFDFDGIRLD